MNKIYSLKYCPVTQGLIAVSELASRVVKRTSRKLKQISLISISVTCLSYPMMSQAGIVRDDISYQLFRDFAENKGLFVPGATDISSQTRAWRDDEYLQLLAQCGFHTTTRIAAEEWPVSETFAGKLYALMARRETV